MSKGPSHAVSAIKVIADRLDTFMERGGMTNSSHARRIHAEVNRLRSGAEALDRVNSNMSPLDTPAAHTLKVAKLARKFDAEAAASLKRVGAAMCEAYADVQKRIDEKVKLIPHPLAPEIRATYKALSPKDQADLITKLINENDGPVLAALLDGPSMLTGMNEGERKAYQQGIIARHAAAELEEQTNLEEIFESATVVAHTASNLTKTFTDPGMLARIEAGDAAAHEAGVSFDRAMSPE